MGVNLEEHKVFIESENMEMVPYEIAVKAITDILEEHQMEDSLKELEESIKELKKTLGGTNIDQIYGN